MAIQRTFVGIFYITLLLSTHPINAGRAAHANSLIEKASNLDSVLQDLQQARDEDSQEEAASAQRVQDHVRNHDSENHTRVEVLEDDLDLAGPFHEENMCDQTLFLRYKDGQKQKESTFQMKLWDSVELFKKSDTNGCVKTYTAICARGGMLVSETCKSTETTKTEFRRFRYLTGFWRKTSISESQAVQLQTRTINGTDAGNTVQLTSGGRLDVWVKDRAAVDQACASKKMNFQAKMADVNDKLAESNSSKTQLRFIDAARLVLQARAAAKELKGAQKDGCPWISDQSVDAGPMKEILQRDASKNPCFEKAKDMLQSSKDAPADVQQAVFAEAMQTLLSENCQADKQSDNSTEPEEVDMSLDSLEQDLDEKAEKLQDQHNGLELGASLLQTVSETVDGGITALIVAIVVIIVLFFLIVLLCWVVMAIITIMLAIIFCTIKALIISLIYILSFGTLKFRWTPPMCMRWWLEGLNSPSNTEEIFECAASVMRSLTAPARRHHRHRHS